MLSRMNRFRRHRWRTPISLLAMLALVWAQLVLASHPACAVSAMASMPAHAEHADHAQPAAADPPPPCHGASLSEDAPLCASHCSQGDLSKAAPRLVPVPTLGPVSIMSVVTVQRLPDAAGHAVAARPRVAWHRPTPHPASLLLI